MFTSFGIILRDFVASDLTLGMPTFTIMTLGIMTFSRTALNGTIIVIALNTECCYTECHSSAMTLSIMTFSIIN